MLKPIRGVGERGNASKKNLGRGGQRQHGVVGEAEPDGVWVPESSSHVSHRDLDKNPCTSLSFDPKKGWARWVLPCLDIPRFVLVNGSRVGWIKTSCNQDLGMCTGVEHLGEESGERAARKSNPGQNSDIWRVQEL